MHKYPFCFTFLVSRIFLLLLLPLVFFLFFCVFVPCLLRFMATIWYEIREYLDTDIHTYIHTLSFVQFVLNSVRCANKQTNKKNNSHDICLLLSCKRKLSNACLAMFFFSSSFFLSFCTSRSF